MWIHYDMYIQLHLGPGFYAVMFSIVCFVGFSMRALYAKRLHGYSWSWWARGKGICFLSEGGPKFSLMIVEKKVVMTIELGKGRWDDDKWTKK
jgi:hypothetical protein